MSIRWWLAVVVVAVIASATWHAGGEAAPRQTEFYVASHGDDDNPGTKELPWKTLSAVNDRQFAPGDTVYFARGSSFHGGFVVTSSGTRAAPIVLTSYGEGPLPKFTNSDIRHLNGNVILVKGSHIVIDGLYFHNGPSAPTAVRWRSTSTTSSRRTSEFTTTTRWATSAFWKSSRAIRATSTSTTT